jgi:hypothetical protein
VSSNLTVPTIEIKGLHLVMTTLFCFNELRSSDKRQLCALRNEGFQRMILSAIQISVTFLGESKNCIGRTDRRMV